MDDVLIRAGGVSKKFCRSLARSLWYGIRDSGSDLIALKGGGARKLRRDEFWAVDDVSFEVRRGECLGLIGRNGAGKTTLLKMLNGLVKPDHGRIEMRGRVGALIALGAGFNPILTGRENVYVNGAVIGLSRKEVDAKFDEIVAFAEIEEFIDSPVQSYSSGMQVRLGFAIAAAVQPDILLLDEVLAVGDVKFQAKCFNTLAEFRKRGTAFILVSHNMHMISRYCQEVLYLRSGQVMHLGETEAGIARLAQDSAIAISQIAADGTEREALGSGRVRFTRTRFFDRDDQPITQIDVGDPVSLILDYERDDQRVTSAILDVIVRDGSEVVYQGSRTFDGLFDGGQLKIEFKYLPNNVENLDFAVALLDGQTAEVFDWNRDLKLRLRRHPSHQGRLFLPSNWTMMPVAVDAPTRQGALG